MKKAKRSKEATTEIEILRLLVDQLERRLGALEARPYYWQPYYSPPVYPYHTDPFQPYITWADRNATDRVPFPESDILI